MARLQPVSANATWLISKKCCTHSQNSSGYRENNKGQGNEELVYASVSIHKYIKWFKVLTQLLYTGAIVILVPWGLFDKDKEFSEDSFVTSAGQFWTVIAMLTMGLVIVCSFASRTIVRIFYNAKKDQYTVIAHTWHIGMKEIQVKAGHMKLRQVSQVFGQIMGNVECEGGAFFLQPEHFTIPLHYNKLLGFA